MMHEGNEAMEPAVASRSPCIDLSCQYTYSPHEVHPSNISDIKCFKDDSSSNRRKLFLHLKFLRRDLVVVGARSGNLFQIVFGFNSQLKVAIYSLLNMPEHSMVITRDRVIQKPSRIPPGGKNTLRICV